jgi:23S rRNA U2552 (ribose-2'-O)-methylase RlmE/FtsJ
MSETDEQALENTVANEHSSIIAVGISEGTSFKFRVASFATKGTSAADVTRMIDLCDLALTIAGIAYKIHVQYVRNTIFL